MTIDKNLMERVTKEREKALDYYRDWDYTGDEVMIMTRHGEVRTRFYYPKEKRERMPVFFDIHGGGHVVHKCEADQPLCMAIAEAIDGVVVSIDYHLAPEHQWPHQIEEIYDVIRCISQNEHAYQIDPQKMAIGGHSAGGNLAAIVNLMAIEQKEFRFACQLLCYPETDFRTTPEEKFEGKGEYMIEQLNLFRECYLNESALEDPYYSPAAASNELLRESPPTIIVLCDEDILYREGLEYATRLIEVGVETNVRRFIGSLHGFTADYYDTELGQSGIRYIAKMIAHYIA